MTVRFRKEENNWEARLRTCRRDFSLGRYATEQDARDADESAARLYCDAQLKLAAEISMSYRAPRPVKPSTAKPRDGIANNRTTGEPIIIKGGQP